MRQWDPKQQIYWGIKITVFFGERGGFRAPASLHGAATPIPNPHDGTLKLSNNSIPSSQLFTQTYFSPLPKVGRSWWGGTRTHPAELTEQNSPSRTHTTRRPPLNLSVLSCPLPAQAGTPGAASQWIWGCSGHPDGQEGHGSSPGWWGNDSWKYYFRCTQKISLKSTARGPQTPQPESELVLGHLWGKRSELLFWSFFCTAQAVQKSGVWAALLSSVCY